MHGDFDQANSYSPSFSFSDQKLSNKEHIHNDVRVGNMDVRLSQIQVCIFHKKNPFILPLRPSQFFKKQNAKCGDKQLKQTHSLTSFTLRFTKRQVNDLKLCVCSNVCLRSVRFVSLIDLFITCQ